MIDIDLPYEYRNSTMSLTENKSSRDEIILLPHGKSFWDFLPAEIQDLIEEYCYVHESNKYVGTNEKVWKQNGVTHRDRNRPAVIRDDGTKIWYNHGEKHRDGDLPAYINSDGTQEWYTHGSNNREHDKPSYMDSRGARMWHKNGFLHRLGDKPAIITHRAKYWYQNGRLYRDTDDMGLAQPVVVHVDGSVRWKL